MEHFSAPRSSSHSIQLLRELEALSASLDRAPAFTARKAACLLEFPVGKTSRGDDAITSSRASDLRSRHASFSYWRSGQEKHVDDDDDDDDDDEAGKTKGKRGVFGFWKPMRALSRIGKQKVSCLFCVEVVGVQSLPASMNGQRLAFCVRKKDSKSGVVRTLPSKVSRGGAEFEETLFVTCHVYFSHGSATTCVNFEPRPFVIFALAFDGAREIGCGRSYVDLSKLIQESIEKSFEDAPIRTWDTSFSMSGKAEGGKASLKLSFQIMERDGIATYIRRRRNGAAAAAIKNGERPCPFARRQSKTSFSVPTTTTTTRRSKAAEDTAEYEVVDKGVEVEELRKERAEVSNEVIVVKEVMHHHHRHHHNPSENKVRFRMAVLDSIAQQIKELESMLLGDKGHYWDKLGGEEEMITREFMEMLRDDDDHHEDSKEEEEKSDNWLLAELGDGLGCVVQTRNDGFLVSIDPLRHIPAAAYNNNKKQVGSNVAAGAKREGPRLAMQMSKPLVLDIPLHSEGGMFEVLQRMAAGLGAEGMTSHLCTLMPIEEVVGKSAEQIAFEGIASQIIHQHQQGTSRNSTMAHGPTPTSSNTSFMRTLAVVKSMANAMISGDKSGERCPTAADVLGVSIRKLEEVAVDALKIQAGIAAEEEEEAVTPHSDVSSSCENGVAALFEGAVSLQEWLMRGNEDDENVDICFVAQLRDPVRRYEAVGGPMVVLIHAVGSGGGGGGGSSSEEEKTPEGARLEVGELHVAGILKMRGGRGGGGGSGSGGGGGGGGEGKGNKNNNNNNKNVSWDNSMSGEKESMRSAMQWLVGNGLVNNNNNGRNSKEGGGGGGGGGRGGGGVLRTFPHAKKEGSKNVMWSISSLGRSSNAAAAAGDEGGGRHHVWLKPLRNPNVVFTH